MKLYISLFKNNQVKITTIVAANSENEAVNLYINKGKAKNYITKADLLRIENLTYCTFSRKYKKDEVPTIIKDCVIFK